MASAVLATLSGIVAGAATTLVAGPVAGAMVGGAVGGYVMGNEENKEPQVQVSNHYHGLNTDKNEMKVLQPSVDLSKKETERKQPQQETEAKPSKPETKPQPMNADSVVELNGPIKDRVGEKKLQGKTIAFEQDLPQQQSCVCVIL